MGPGLGTGAGLTALLWRFPSALASLHPAPSGRATETTLGKYSWRGLSHVWLEPQRNSRSSRCHHPFSLRRRPMTFHKSTEQAKHLFQLIPQALSWEGGIGRWTVKQPW